MEKSEFSGSDYLIRLPCIFASFLAGSTLGNVIDYVSTETCTHKINIMKLKSNGFWIFEVMMSVACIITCFLLYIILRVGFGVLFFDWLWLAFIYPPFILGGGIVWKISKNKNWIKLALWEFLIANILLILIMAIFCIGADAMALGYAFIFSVICVLCSILPILLCCYLQKTMSLTKTFD